MFKTKNTRIRTFSYYLYSTLFFYKYLPKKLFKAENTKDFIVAVMGNNTKCELGAVGSHSVRVLWGFWGERRQARTVVPLQLL